MWGSHSCATIGWARRYNSSCLTMDEDKPANETPLIFETYYQAVLS